MSQLRYLINRTNVPAKPKENVNAADEIFQVVVVGHLIAAALNMNTINDSPSSTHFLLLQEEHDIQSIFNSAMVNMIRSYINITSFHDEIAKDQDKVRGYAREILSLGLLLLEFDDSIHEGDGERLKTIWKF